MSVNNADRQAVNGQQQIAPGQFHTVRLALQNAGLIPRPTVSLVDRAAKSIYDAIACAAHRVSNTFKP